MDTIAAIATASGQAGIAIVRISGPGAYPALCRCFRAAGGEPVLAGRLRYGHVVDENGDVLDEAMAAYMPAPHSYTMEDVAEIQCHGGDVNARRVLGRVLQAGARLAEPGEFTRRAFENGRLDLSQAEAVMALVGAGGQAAARAAVRQMRGAVSELIGGATDKLLGMLALIEACVDFPEEVEEQATRQQLIDELMKITGLLTQAADEKRARMVRSGAVAALCGRPNTGKSSLMNALLQWDRAIVTSQPGTTRDTLSESFELDGLTVTLMDTAGQREAIDQVEKMGVARARQAEADADLVLLVVDGSQPLCEEDLDLVGRADERYLAVVNKTDQPLQIDLQKLHGMDHVVVSALTGEGMDTLRQAMKDRLAGASAQEALITGERHLALCGRAVHHLQAAHAGLEGGYPIDVAAVDLQGALEQLWSITGKNARESVIDSVFAMFCVGK